MHAIACSRRHYAARTLLLGLAAGLSLAAQAGEPTAPDRIPTSVAVSYTDLDLTTTAGARTLYTRLRSAAKRACGPEPSMRDLRASVIYRACYDRSLGKAVQRIGSAQLQALHAERAGRAVVG